MDVFFRPRLGFGGPLLAPLPEALKDLGRKAVVGFQALNHKQTCNMFPNNHATHLGPAKDEALWDPEDH